MNDVPQVLPELLPGLRADLAGYTVDAVDAVLGPAAAAALRRDCAAPARRALRDSDDPAAALARLFLLGEEEAGAAVDAALPATGLRGAVALGLVEASGGRVRARVDLRPYETVDGDRWWIASDLGQVATGGPLRTDHVLGVGGASTTLAQLTVRRPVDRVLDLGTGCGVQALHAGRHAAHVTATDVSARALAFARFTTALAGLDVDLRQGDLLTPVTGERFDLVVSNPPFVITPRRPDVPGYAYRDGGLVGDALLAGLVRQVAGVLAPGGVAQLLGSWEHHRGVPWTQRVAGWLEGTGLDAWVVQREVSDPVEYAETWVRDGGQPPGPRFDELVEAWLDDFADRGVVAVGSGYVTLRRPLDGPGTLRRLEEHTGPVHQPLGEHVADVLDVHDVLRRLDDDELLASRWRVASDVTEERHHVPGQPDPSVVLLRQNSGFGRAVQVGTVLAATVGACDGDLALGAVAAALAELLDVPEGEVRAQVAAGVRRLAGDGFVRPA